MRLIDKVGRTRHREGLVRDICPKLRNLDFILKAEKLELVKH